MGEVLNIISVDVEEIYHAEYIRPGARAVRWSRAPRGVEEALSLLDRLSVEATFFLVGKVVEKHPGLLRAILDRGHEVGFHGYSHKPLWRMTPSEFRKELALAKKVLGRNCKGFRAPSFSLDTRTPWALSILAEEGYIYDSSVFPARTPLYGLPDAPTRPYRPSLFDPRVEDNDAPIIEFPILTLEFNGIRIPLGGGFYFRLFPIELLLKIIHKLNEQGVPAVIYVHSWELDPMTPRIAITSPLKFFVTYYRLGSTSKKLASLLSKGRFTSFRRYLEHEGFI